VEDEARRIAADAPPLSARQRAVIRALIAPAPQPQRQVGKSA
jgi:hypothetical protein